jgi:hypothetical protein
MTKIVWQLYNNRTATYYQDIILSASYQYGRQGYLDNYSGQSINITIKNQANESANFQLNDWIGLTGDLSPYQAYNQSFWVTAISYQDYPGNTGLSTATITASDAMHRLGRVLGKGDTLSAGTTGAQIDSMDTKSSWPPNITTFSWNTSSQASAATVTQSWNNQINLLQTTEKGILSYSNGRAINLLGRGYITNLQDTTPSLTRTATATNIGYQTFSRLGYGSTFVNTAEITPTGLGTSTGVNTDSVTLYGQNGITQSTVDANATQAQGNADWTATALSDPTVLRFECGFNDVSQDENMLLAFLQNVTGFGIVPLVATDLVYRVPGAGSDTTVAVVVEGWSLNITPSQTDFNFYLSPLTYYQFFTLNSTTLGILDTSRLGW